MKRNIVSIFLFVLFLYPHTAFSQAQPRISFAETFHNFGETLQNTMLKHSFLFENKGSSTLIIEDIKSG